MKCKNAIIPTSIEGVTLNRIDKESIPTLNAGQNRSGSKTRNDTDSVDRRQTASTWLPNDDNLNLSDGGKLLGRSATSGASSPTAPQTTEQAQALVARIKKQFANDGAQAVKSFTPTRDNELAGLLQTAPA